MMNWFCNVIATYNLGTGLGVLDLYSLGPILAFISGFCAAILCLAITQVMVMALAIEN